MQGVPQRFLESSEDVQLEIINVGTFIYYNGLRWMAEEQTNTELQSLRKDNASYESRLQELRDQYARQVDEIKKDIEDHYKGMLDNARDQHRLIVDSTKEQMRSSYVDVIESYKNQVADAKARYDGLVATMNSQSETYVSRIRELENQNAQAIDLSGKLDSLIGKSSKVDNAFKGDFGEAIVRQQIQHYFPCSNVEDMSGTTASGDLHWKMHGDAFRCLVEVKNVQHVRPSDLTKYDRDLQKNLSDGTCNCGLFVSLKTECIPNKGAFALEFVNGCPVVYVCNVFVDLSMLRIALHLVHNVQVTLCSANESEESAEYRRHICSFVEQIHERLLHSRKNILQMKNAMEHLSNAISSEERMTNQSMNQLLNLRQNVQWTGCTIQDADVPSTGGASDKKRKLVDAVYEFYMLHKRWPMTRELDNDTTGIRARHFRGEHSMHNIRECVQAMLDQNSE